MLKKNDLDISFQLKRSDCMKRRQVVCTLFTAELKDAGSFSRKSGWKSSLGRKLAGEHRSSWIFLALFTYLQHGNLCHVI